MCDSLPREGQGGVSLSEWFNRLYKPLPLLRSDQTHPSRREGIKNKA